MLLRDVIDIPERAGAEDYVLRLTDSVGDAARRTLDQYVVTPDLADSFDDALALVTEAIGSNVSRGSFLTGSFGSGKSHFMAVLHALLRRDPAARAKAELQPVIARHDDELHNATILPLAFHLLGADSLEQALFDGYIRQVRQLHPQASLPAVHESDHLLIDAQDLREQLGDDNFFARLNGGAEAGADDEWAGVLGSGTWDAARYDEARAAAPDAPLRQQLVSALVETYFRAFTQGATYHDLDTGLAAISAHAKQLGYDAVVLFLDELVLWLAFSVQDREFFRRESQKLTKLVESTTGTRAIPLVSFVARQMDLRRWFADAGASGNEQEALDRAFRHQEGRFSTIELGDDNLPYVARQRLLRRKDEQSERVIQEAFASLERRPAVWDVLLDGINTDESHRGADEAAFRMTYPFSPALVSTLRSLAGVMQRERTALKVMQQLLVDRRDLVTVDDVIPAGDAYQYIVQGQGTPLDAKAAALFRSANQLYLEKIQPLLLSTHGLTSGDLDEPGGLPAAYRTDDRLAKTLLLAAVAPNVPALKNLTASRLASLNHGSIVSPLPGNEANMVLAKVRDWSRTVPEIRVDGEHRDPVIQVQLSDVDYESVVERAKGEENEGRRRELVKSLVIESLRLDLGDADMLGVHQHEIVWRGSKRRVDLLFGNVRDSAWLTEDHFRHREGTWRLVIDHPFDEAGHSSAEDVARLDRLQGGLHAQTVVWLPHFLSEDRMRDLRRLVVLDWLLGGTGERWASHADHLSEHDRVQAKAILEAQRQSLRDQLMRVLEQAYGVVSPVAGALLDEGRHEQVLTSLDRGFGPGTPGGATLASSFEALVHRAFDATYPAHPRFEPPDVEVRARDLKAVHEHLDRAMGDPDKRVPLQGDTAAVRRVANALGVGHASETHFLFGDDRFTPWGNDLARALGKAGGETQPVSVGDLRGWIAEVQPARGLRPEVTDLVVIGWALLRQRAWYHHGAPVPTPSPGQLQPGMELRQQEMPTSEQWTEAVAKSGQLFGISEQRFMTAAAVAKLAEQVKEAAAEKAPPAQALVIALQDAAKQAGLDGGSTRLATAERAASLVEALRNMTGVTLIRQLAGADLGDRATALGTSLAQAREVAESLRRFPWERLSPLRAASDPRAAAILDELRTSLRNDQIVTRVQDALATAENEAFQWLAGRTATAPAPTPPASETRPQGPETPESDADAVTLPVGDRPVEGRDATSFVIDRGEPAEAVVSRLQAFLDEHQGQRVEVRWWVAE